MTKHFYHLYVDDKHVDTKLYGWSATRIMRHLERKYPDAKRLEVRKHDARTGESLFKLKS